MKHLNNFNCLTRKFESISSINSGIIRTGYSGLNIVTGSMPAYIRLAISPDHDMNYHISGYENSIEEAFVRFIGESIERYVWSLLRWIYAILWMQVLPQSE